MVAERGRVDIASHRRKQPIPDHGVAIQKPDWVGMPYFVTGLWQSLVDLTSQKVTNLAILRTERLVLLNGVGGA
jgi:hypothetical protein